MKRTIGLVAAMILLGVFVVACNQKPAESTSAPAPSPTPAATEEPVVTEEPVATEEPAATEEPEAVEDTGLLQPVTADTSNASTADTSEITQTKEDIDAIISAHDEEVIQELMNTGMSREEAEAALQQVKDKAEAKKAEIDKNRQEYREQWEAEHQRTYEENMAKKEQWAQETYGISYDEYKSMTSEEQYQLNYETRMAEQG